VPLDDGAVVIVDYGASQGRNSMAPMSAAVDPVRGRRPGHPILVFHTDLPNNDFTSLFTIVAEDPQTYRRPEVFTAVIERSFYDRLLPSTSVALGWSSIALHWLEGVPGPLRGIWYADSTAEQHAVWKVAAARDWLQFLSSRAEELAAGGELVIVCGAADAYGSSGAEPAMAIVNAELAAMTSERLLTPTERESLAIPAWYRTVDEWRAPFAADEIGLQLVGLELVELGDPLWDEKPTLRLSRGLGMTPSTR
jgi:SAM dependent carboxyl methyltransferase